MVFFRVVLNSGYGVWVFCKWFLMYILVLVWVNGCKLVLKVICCWNWCKWCCVSWILSLGCLIKIICSSLVCFVFKLLNKCKVFSVLLDNVCVLLIKVIICLFCWWSLISCVWICLIICMGDVIFNCNFVVIVCFNFLLFSIGFGR